MRSMARCRSLRTGKISKNWHKGLAGDSIGNGLMLLTIRAGRIKKKVLRSYIN